MADRQVARPRFSDRIGVSERLLTHAVVADHVDDAPVPEPGHDDVRESGHGRLVLEALRQHGRYFGHQMLGLLRALEIGHVDRDAMDLTPTVVRLARSAQPRVKPHASPARSPEVVLDRLIYALVVQRPAKTSQDMLAIFGRGMAFPEIRFGELLRRVAQDAPGLPTHERELVRRGIHRPGDGVLDALDQLAISVVARHPQLGESQLVLAPFVLSQGRGLSLDLTTLQIEVGEDGDLHPHDVLVERLRQIVDRADGVRLVDLAGDRSPRR